MTPQEDLIKKRGPSNVSDNELRRAGLQWIDPRVGILGCTECGHRWVIDNPGQGNKLPRGYWHCLNGCNNP